MELKLDNDEVTRALINYASNNLHLPVNRAQVNAEGSVTLWWEAPPPAPRKSRTALQLMGYAISSLWRAPYRFVTGHS